MCAAIKISGRNPRIGFQVPRISISYSSMYVPSIRESCRARSADLVVFAGGTLLSPFTFDYQLNAIYRYLKPANIDALILLTATVQSYTTAPVFKQFYDALSGLPIISIAYPLDDYPSLLIDNRAGLAEAVRHLAQEHGKKRIAFIKGPDGNGEAQERLDAYLTTIRECGLEDDPALVCPGDFTSRSGTQAVSLLLDQRRVSFDALVAANDDMALTAMFSLQQRGLRVPEDVAVIGFDDLTQSAYTTPGLTTVRQPFSVQGALAVELALDMIAGKNRAGCSVMPTELVVRASCGCLPHAIEVHNRTRSVISGIGTSREAGTPETALTHIRKLTVPPEIREDQLVAGSLELFRLFDELSRGVRDERAFLTAMQRFSISPGWSLLGLQFWEQACSVISSYVCAQDPSLGTVLQAGEKACLLFQEARSLLQNRVQYQLIEDSSRFQNIMEMLLLTRDLPDLYAALAQIMPVMDIRNFFVVIHKPVKNRMDAIMPPLKAEKRLVLAIQDGHQLDTASEIVDDESLLPRRILDSLKDYQLIVSSIYYREELFGYTCVEPGSYSMSLYDNLLLELGSVIKRCFLDVQQKRTENKLREALQKLRESNQKLADLSQTDELTRLYNRRGFIEMATHSLSFAYRMKKEALLIFVDLDGLKKINDTWGHAAGDDAIKGAAIVLKATFRQVDILSRLGGDEFIVLTLDSPNSTRDIILERLQNNIGIFNESNANPWALSMSIGVLSILPDEKRPLEELMKIADALQYQEKIAKRKNRQ